MGLKELSDKFNEVKKELAEKGKAEVFAEFDELFKSHPEVLAARWTQYTPFFNDGDVCTFSVGEMGFKLQGMTEGAGDYGNGFESLWGLGYHEETKNNPAVPVLRQFSSKFQSDAVEQIFLSAFGDSVQVTVTRDGVEVEDYEHE